MRHVFLALALVVAFLAPFTTKPVQADPIACNKIATVNVPFGTTLQVIPVLGNTTIYVCSFAIGSTAASLVQFVAGTGANCVTGQTLPGGTLPIAVNGAVIQGTGSGVLFSTPAGNALCVSNAGGTAADTGSITYAQF